MFDYSIFTEGLQKFTKRCGYTQQQLADALGCSNGNANQIFKGKVKITFLNLVRLFELGMRLEEAFGDEVAAVIRSGEMGAVTPGERLTPAQIVQQGLAELFAQTKNQKP